MKGFINVLKPCGMSSAQAVAIVKHKFHCPCGHMGTLDPMASGVLPVGIGKTSRLFPFLLSKTKVYLADIKFGILTDTLDTTGTVTDTSPIIPSEKELREVFRFFIGEIEQIPPKYSAKCVAGKKAYVLSRKGVDFELEPRKVVVNSIEFVGKISPTEYRVRINCEGGTYIRSLCRDFGLALNTFAVMSGLKREKCGIFDYENGITPDKIKELGDLSDYIIPPDMAVDFPKLVLDGKTAQRILDGVFDNLGYKDGIYRVYNQTEFWGIGESKGGYLRITAYVR